MDFITEPQNIIYALTLIVGSLSAFFTLATGTFAVAVAYYIYRNKQLVKKRKQEVKEVQNLQISLENKLEEAENKLSKGGDKGEIKKDIQNLKSDLYDLKMKSGGLLQSVSGNPMSGPVGNSSSVDLGSDNSHSGDLSDFLPSNSSQAGLEAND